MLHVENVTTAKETSGRQPTIREENLPGHLQGEDRDEDSGEEKKAEPAEGAGAGDGADAQLDRALELLKSWNVFKAVVAQRQP